MKYRGVEVTRVQDTGYVRRGRWHVPPVCWVVYAGTDQQRAFLLLRTAKAQIDIDLAREA